MALDGPIRAGKILVVVTTVFIQAGPETRIEDACSCGRTASLRVSEGSYPAGVNGIRQWWLVCASEGDEIVSRKGQVICPVLRAVGVELGRAEVGRLPCPQLVICRDRLPCDDHGT